MRVKGGSNALQQRSSHSRSVGTHRSPRCVASLTAGATSPHTLRALGNYLYAYGTKSGAGAALNIAAVSPLLHHATAGPVPHPGEAAIVTVAGLMTVALSLGGVTYYGARSAWEKLEPLLTSRPDTIQAEPASFYGVDVTGSRFFGREAVQRAVEFAAVAHKGQTRKTKEPYVTHCIETAMIVESLLSPSEDDERAEAAVITALLHDVMDDAGVDAGTLKLEFGPQVASMVSKVSQLSATNQLVRRRLRLEDAERTAQEAAQLRQMILTMVSEPLVIVVKLADRLHNMRTVYALAPEKQRAVAEETRRVWCSLAERLGMFALKSELEDLCFTVLQPAEYRALRAELDTLWGVRTISLGDMTPEDCCLTGECECSTDGSMDAEDHATVAHLSHAHSDSSEGALPSRSGGTWGWLGTAHTAIPAIRNAGGSGAELATPSPATPDADDPEAAFLSREQLEVRDLLRSVLPFDASTFNMDRLNITPSMRRGLEVLQGCARALLQEITTEGYAAGLDVSVQGRVKSLYSSFKKMARKRVPLSQVYDARALRVVVDDEGGSKEREALATCYKLLPAVHRLWRKVAGEDDDYIAMPKESGYQSLHTAVMGPGGVPMEVQIRTSTMHEVAEYGKAAHWAYKERPSMATATHSSDAPSPEAIALGHPVLRISPGGQLQDGVVVQSEAGGMRLLVAVSLMRRRYASALATEASREEYGALLQYVESKGYFTAGQGDMQVALELFTLCSDGKYHRMDQFGHKLPTTVVPLRALAPIAELQTVSPAHAEVLVEPAGPAPEHGSGAGGDAEMAYMNNHIRLMRSILEWGADIGSLPVSGGLGVQPGDSSSDSDGGGEGTETQLGDVMVLVWPSGRILRVPRGTTAGTVVQCELQSHSGDGSGVDLEGDAIGLVNVNNRLVPGDQVLQDGDYVVLTKETVKV